jgi:hypothetical protein
LRFAVNRSEYVVGQSNRIMRTIGPVDAVVLGFAAIVLSLLPDLAEGTQNLRGLLTRFAPRGIEGENRRSGQIWFVAGGFTLILIGVLDYFLNLAGA